MLETFSHNYLPHCNLHPTEWQKTPSAICVLFNVYFLNLENLIFPLTPRTSKLENQQTQTQLSLMAIISIIDLQQHQAQVDCGRKNVGYKRSRTESWAGKSHQLMSFHGWRCCFTSQVGIARSRSLSFNLISATLFAESTHQTMTACGGVLVNKRYVITAGMLRLEFQLFQSTSTSIFQVTASKVKCSSRRWYWNTLAWASTISRMTPIAFRSWTVSLTAWTHLWIMRLRK